MPDDIVLRPQGRVSEPSPDAAPAGSMLVAENVVIREEGIARHLGNGAVISSGAAPADVGAWNISPQFDNGDTPAQLVYVGDADGSSDGVRSSGDLATEIQYADVDGASTTVQYFDFGDGEAIPPMYIARDNLYLSDQRGVYKWQNTGNSTINRVWDTDMLLVDDDGWSGAATNQWLDNGEHVRYVGVVVFEDSNGVINRSAPGPGALVNNTSGSSQEPELLLYITDDVAEDPSFRGLEVYRTRTFANTIALPELYFLVGEVPVADFSEASIGTYYTSTYADIISAEDLGASLYTNDDLANFAPPEHLYHASFRGHEFWGNVSEKEIFPVLKTQSSDSNMSHDMTGDITSGSNVVTNVTNNGVEVGMLVFENTYFPRGTYVTDISGSTFTLSEDATGTQNSVFFNSWDTAYVLWGDGSESRFPLDSISNLWDGYTDSPFDLIDLFGTSLGFDSAYRYEFRVASRHRTARSGPAQMWVSNPEQFPDVDWPDLATGDGSPTTGGLEAEQASHLARIYWSKFQEPEHTTLANFVDVGNASGIGGGQIVGLGALREALIILKEDGVFRLTGDRGNWRIDPIDTSIRMIGGRTTRVLNDRVIALSERGLVSISASAVQDLTDGIISDWFREPGLGSHRAGDIRLFMVENDGYHPPLLQAAVDTTNREYVLIAEGTRGGDSGSTPQALVYNAKTGSFTTWTLSPSANLAALGYARGDYTDSVDQHPGIVFSRLNGSDQPEIVLIQNQPGVDGSDFPVEIRFRARTEGDPTHIKLWVDSAWQMVPGGDDRADVECIFQPSEAGNTETVAVADDSGTRQIRCWVPRGTARSDELVAGLSGDNVAIRGVRLSFRSSGRRPPLAND